MPTSPNACAVCSVAHGLGFCEAAEQIAGSNWPGHAGCSLAFEIERLYNHVGDMANTRGRKLPLRHLFRRRA